VNSRFGRTAGDDLLQQFALELHALFPAAEQIGRCSGDEFAAIITTSYRDALASVNRLRHAALGEYKVNTGEQFVVVRIEAAIGLVEWDGAESGEELLNRAATISRSVPRLGPFGGTHGAPQLRKSFYSPEKSAQSAD
jgi:diguanylate cyclase (GGDEF)-like protein